MSKRGLSAVDARPELRSDSAAALRAALHETDIDRLALADAAGVDPAIVSRQGSRSGKHAWTGVDLVAWLRDDETRPVGLRLMQWIGTQTGLEIVAKRAASSAGDLFHMLAASMDAGHGVTRAITDAVCPNGDGGAKQTDAELERIVATARTLGRVAAEVEHAATAELQDRRGRAVVS